MERSSPAKVTFRGEAVTQKREKRRIASIVTRDVQRDGQKKNEENGGYESVREGEGNGEKRVDWWDHEAAGTLQ